jgi:hypothetical protein
MARHIRYGGLASIVIVDNDKEIDALLDHPELDRTYNIAGPPLNRLMISRLRHALFRDGRALLSFASRGDAERATAQGALATRLDALAEQRPWAREAITAMATYVAKGTDRETALAALTYTMAYPFLTPENAVRPFEPTKFGRVFDLFKTLQLARIPWKGLPTRLRGLDKQASREILETLNGDDYGLHAVGITLANSVPSLDRIRALFADPPPVKSRISELNWNTVRVAPVAVTRQNKVPCTLPGGGGEIPANSLILFKMRQGQRPDSAPGFEFASSHWSFCPASRYVEAVFSRVYDAAKNHVGA